MCVCVCVCVCVPLCASVCVRGNGFPPQQFPYCQLTLTMCTHCTYCPPELHEALDGETNVVEFDFLGKDSIRYQNHVSVDKQVFKNLRLFTKGKDPGHDLFDRLSVSCAIHFCHIRTYVHVVHT